MYEAITYKGMLKRISTNESEGKIVGILLTQPKSPTGGDILYHLDYFHHRTSNILNLYLAGYGALWPAECYPDKFEVIKINGEKWSFSAEQFSDFIDSLEAVSTWDYSGESELLLLYYQNQTVDYSDVLRFNLDAMLRDNAIPSVESFLECIYKGVKKRPGLKEIANNAKAGVAFSEIAEGIFSASPPLGFIWGACKKGRHYLVKDYSLVP